jgi:heat shock protein HslJ
MKKLVVIVSLVLAGCAAPPPATVQASVAAPPLERVSVDDLRGGEWVVTAIDGVDTITAPAPLLRWAGSDTVGGTGGCNNFVGRFTLTGDQIALGPLASTRMACMASPQGQEDKFFNALEKTRKARMDGKVLLLTDDTDRVLLRLHRP